MHKRITVLILLSTIVLVFLVSYSVIVKANKPSVTPVDPYDDILSFYSTQMASTSISEEEKEALKNQVTFLERELAALRDHIAALDKDEG